MTDQKKLLQIDSVTKVFPGVRALGKVTFSVLAGEVHGLIGENGAGKSTLMAVAAGALVPEEGRIVIDGVEAMGDTERARFLGLAIVRQEPALMPDLTMAENLYLGVPEAERPSLMDLSAWVRRLLEQWSDDVAIDSGARVLSLNPERRFIVEIVKAVAAKPKVLVLDEPTEHLLAEDVERLFERIRNITASGCAVVYISHRIREVRKIANRLTVLPDGQGQGTYDAAGLSEQQIVELIVGRAVDSEFPPKSTETASDIVFKVDSLNGTRFANISLELRKGEIVGLAGIDGNGQREFMRALAGLVNSRGRATLNERPLSLRNSRICARAGIVFLPEDRHSEEIFAGLSVARKLVDSQSWPGLDPRPGQPAIRDAKKSAHGPGICGQDPVDRDGHRLAVRWKPAEAGNGERTVHRLCELLAARRRWRDTSDGAGWHGRRQHRRKLYAGEHRGGRHRRREPVRRAWLLCWLFARRFASDADQHRDHIPRSRQLVAVLLAGSHDSRFGPVFHKPADGGGEMTARIKVSPNLDAIGKVGLSRLSRLFSNVGEFSWIWIATLALFALSTIIAPGTVTSGSLLAMVPFAGILAMVATGQTVVIQQRGLDLSSAGTLGLGGILFGLVGAETGSLLAAVAAAIVSGAAVGAINGLLVARVGITPLVATLSVNAIVIGGIRWLTGYVPISVPAEMQGISRDHFLGLPITVIFALVFVAATAVVIHATVIGRRFIAVGSSPRAAEAAGVPVLFYQVGSYVAAGVCFAVSGLLLAGFIAARRRPPATTIPWRRLPPSRWVEPHSLAVAAASSPAPWRRCSWLSWVRWFSLSAPGRRSNC